MAPTFDELVERTHTQTETGGILAGSGTKTADNEDRERRVVARVGKEYDGDEDELRWRAQYVERYKKLGVEHRSNEAELAREKKEAAGLRRALAANTEQQEKILKLVRVACEREPGMVRGLREILEEHSGESDTVDENRPDFEAMEVRIGECASGLAELRKGMSNAYESEISGLRLKVQEKDVLIQAQSRELEDKEKVHGSEISGFRSQVQQRDVQIQAQSREIEEKETAHRSEMSGLMSQIKEKDVQIQAQSREMGEKDKAHRSEISGLMLQIKEKDARIQAQSREIEEKQKVHQSEISGLKSQVQERDTQIQAQSQEIEGKGKALQEKDAMLLESNRQISARERDITEKDLQLERSEGEKRAAIRSRAWSLRQETLHANGLQRELDTVRAMDQSLHRQVGELTGEVLALCVELDQVRQLERSAMLLVGSEQRRLGQEVERLVGRMAGRQQVFDREISTWLSREEEWRQERLALVQQRQSAFDALAVLEMEKEVVETELAGVGDQLSHCLTELGEMASSIDWLDDRLADREESIRTGFALLRAALWAVQMLRVWGGYLLWVVVAAWYVVRARDTQIAALNGMNRRLGEGVAARDAQIVGLNNRIGQLVGAVNIGNARVFALCNRVADLVQEAAAENARILALRRQVENLRWESCPLVGLNPREVIAERGTLLSRALTEWERSQVADEGRSLADCVLEVAGQVVPTMDGQWIFSIGDSLVVVGNEVLVVPLGGYRIFLESSLSRWLVVEYGSVGEYGKPRVLLRVALNKTAPMDDMFLVAMDNIFTLGA